MSRQNLSIILAICLVIFTGLLQWWQSQANPPALGVQTETDSETAVVSRVVDGDTIELSDGRKVRYIGIDTPETKHPSKGEECYGQAAADKNAQLVSGQTVRLEKDVNESDRYGRLLRYVWLGDQMINQQLVAEGYAVARSYPPDVKYQDQLRAAEQMARKTDLGLWSSCSLSASPSPLPDCAIKGNISDNGRLYHTPDCGSYSAVKIDESKGERWFCSEEEAQAAGWSRASNCP